MSPISATDCATSTVLTVTDFDSLQNHFSMGKRWLKEMAKGDG